MCQDLILVESLAQNDADIRATIAQLQKIVDQNKALAWTTLDVINKWNHMRKFNRVIEMCCQVLKKPPVSPATSQPFVSASSTPPPLTRDASRTLTPSHSTKSSQTHYTPYAGNRQSTSPNTIPLDPKVTNAIYQEMQKPITPTLTYKLKSTGQNSNPVKKELSQQRQIAEINTALQQNQKKLIATPTQSTPVSSSSRRTQPAGPLPTQAKAYKSADKGKNVV